MKDLKRIEESKLIAAFMGRELHTDDISGFDEYFKPLRYEDCNRLMPVIEKCKDILDSFEFDSKERITIEEEIFNLDNTSSEFMSNNIEAIYRKVIRFINWYNKVIKDD
jgi:hypothetical protein